MADQIVYQVRSVDHFGNVRIVHAYETEDDAKKAIVVMKQRSGGRYTYVPVPNQPHEHWGINFPGSDPITSPFASKIGAPVPEPVVEEELSEPIAETPVYGLKELPKPKVAKAVPRKKK